MTKLWKSALVQELEYKLTEDDTRTPGKSSEPKATYVGDVIMTHIRKIK